MSDLTRGPRPVAAAIQARLERIGAGLTPEQYARMVGVVAEKQEWELKPMSAAGREKVRRGRDKRTIHAAD
jgi:hypothetical protein